MFGPRLLAVIALVGLAGTPALAQTIAPVTPARPVLPIPAPKAPATQAPLTRAPAATAPTATTSTTTAPAVASTPAPSTTMVNLNTATATQLDALPSVGKARVKVILAERAKGAFKNWADFDARTAGTSVNAGVKAKIKDHVTF